MHNEFSHETFSDHEDDFVNVVDVDSTQMNTQESFVEYDIMLDPA